MPDLYDSMSPEQLQAEVQKRMAGQAPTSVSPQAAINAQNVQSSTGDRYDQMSPDELAAEFQKRAAARGEDPTALPGFASSVAATQKMPDDVSAYSRFVVSNFSNSPYASMQYLKEKYPDYDVRHDNDQILMRKQGTDEWRVLNPNLSTDTFTNPSEGLQKLAGNAYPLAQGLASNAAADAAGGAVALTPAAPAAIPTAMAAGGAANAGLEGLRAEIGKVLGLNQDLNTSDMKWAGAAGLLAPLLFGTGGSSKSITENALKEGLSKDAAEAAAKWQKGLLPTLISPITGTATGIAPDTVETAFQRTPELKAMEQQGGVTAVADSASDSLKGKLSNALKQQGEAISDALENSGNKISIAEAKQPLQDRISQLETLYAKAPTDANKAELEQAKNIYSELFLSNTPEQKASTLLGENGKPLVEAVASGKAAAPDQVDPNVAMNLLQQLKEYGSFLGNPSAKAADKVSTSSKLLQNAANESYGNLSDQIDQALAGEGAAGARAQYAKYKEIQRNILPKFDDPEKAYNTLRTLGRKDKKVLFETLQGVDSDLGTNLLDDAKLIDAHANFSRAPLLNRAAPLALVGGGLGAYATSGGGHGGYGPAALGGAVGLGLGAGLASPAALRMMFPLVRGAQNVSPWLVPGLLNTSQQTNEQNDLGR